MFERILIVGYGSIGRRHLRVVRSALPNANIRVLRRSATMQAIEGGNVVYTQLQDALAFFPQLAVISSPASEHLHAAGALVSQGCHVLIEKPLSLPEEDTADFTAICKAQPEVTVQVGYNLRYLDSLRHFRQLILENTSGKVLSVRCDVGQYLPDWRPSQDYRDSASARRALGGGVLMELSHELDYLQWIFGRCDWVSAYLGCHSDLALDVEDTAQLSLGHSGYSSAGDKTEVVVALCMDFYRRDVTRRCTAICERGSITWDAIDGQVKCQVAGVGAPEVVLQSSPPRDESYTSQWQDFMQAAAGSQCPCVGLDDGLSVINVICAARRSNEAGSARVTVVLAEEL